MASPYAGVTYTIKLKSTGAVVSTGVTNVLGKITKTLTPGEYTVEITVPAGHVLSNSVLTEPGQAPVNVATTIIQDVTIVEAMSTTIVSNFLTS